MIFYTIMTEKGEMRITASYVGCVQLEDNVEEKIMMKVQ